MGTVVAKNSYRIPGKGSAVHIHKGEVRNADDPVVKAHPDLFEASDTAVKSQQKPKNTRQLGKRSMSGRKVETSRQKPGDQRSQPKGDDA